MRYLAPCQAEGNFPKNNLLSRVNFLLVVYWRCVVSYQCSQLLESREPEEKLKIHSFLDVRSCLTAAATEIQPHPHPPTAASPPALGLPLILPDPLPGAAPAHPGSSGAAMTKGKFQIPSAVTDKTRQLQTVHLPLIPYICSKFSSTRHLICCHLFAGKRCFK